jgi:hypothetical protein
MNPLNPKNKDSKKVVYAVIITILVLLIIYAISISFGVKKISGVDVDKHLDGSTTYSNDQVSVTAGGENNTWPANWPSDVPAYTNAKILTAVSSDQIAAAAVISVNFSTTDTAQTVVDFYKTKLAANGWKVNPAVEASTFTVLSAAKDKRNVSVTVDNNSVAGQLKVIVSIVDKK